MTAVVEWSREELTARRDDVLDVYAEAMDVPRPAARGRRSILTAHLERRGLRAVAAVEEGGLLIGVAYGYLGSPGQWWHDRVRAAVTDDQSARWLEDSFEVCELHVRPGHQGLGWGRRLLDDLLAGPPALTATLTTPDSETRARAFYRAGGWVDLVRNLVFPGDPRAFAVLAKDLRRA